ncbi:phage tail tube protein [Streptococcus oralis]|uniref:Putative major tail protein n=1 Tax=Streptococcus oralis TaxID=1303 RepID=A0A139QKY4_STROR|nr:phage tail tube protein [Streptococcus oralis]KXU03174.1 putative major tail protein [Streptococcus oralis]QBX17451.1 putative major tail protein [Streptococcus phage Javan355]DAU15242.1 MAG TPA: tail tube protein [Caudoviricetes sp.]
MLANGIKLAFSKTKGDYQNLVGLKEVPEFGIEPEKVENTTLADKVKKYEFGIGDAGELEYKFAYDNTTATSPYRVLRNAADNKEKLYFEQTYPDGTKVTFEGQVSVKLGGGGVNSVIEFTLKIALQSELTFVDGIGG